MPGHRLASIAAFRALQGLVLALYVVEIGVTFLLGVVHIYGSLPIATALATSFAVDQRLLLLSGIIYTAIAVLLTIDVVRTRPTRAVDSAL
ncbi:hypothetical protein ATCC90586_001498 [Pythium insidiosum]|nr:hypothetical protein ATCC90586_001498 [Pythium insidiosum]